jgi:hypothetical protein
MCPGLANECFVLGRMLAGGSNVNFCKAAFARAGTPGA